MLSKFLACPLCKIQSMWYLPVHGGKASVLHHPVPGMLPYQGMHSQTLSRFLLAYYSDHIHCQSSLLHWWLVPSTGKQPRTCGRNRGYSMQHCSTSPPHAQDTTQSQEAKVPTRNSSLCWQFGEIWAQGPAAIYSSGQAGILLHLAFCGPLLLLSLLLFIPGLHCHSMAQAGPHRQCRKSLWGWLE